jgi:alpha-1,3-rhamnosyl/mannosyltransferase
LASAARIIVPSASAKVAVAGRLRITSTRLSVIHEAADTRFHQSPPAAEIEATLRCHGLVPGYVLYVGGLDPKKDVATLLRAVARTASAGHVTVVAGAADGAWNALATSAGAARIVRVESPTDDELRCLYAAAGCFVFPAIAEGFGLPVVEAMAAGVPVVGANAGALPEVIASGGQLFPPGDDGGLAGVITALLTNDALRDAWATRAAARAREMSWAQAAKATARVLHEAGEMHRLSVFSNRCVRLRSWRAWMPPRLGRPD